MRIGRLPRTTRTLTRPVVAICFLAFGPHAEVQSRLRGDDAGDGGVVAAAGGHHLIVSFLIQDHDGSRRQIGRGRNPLGDVLILRVDGAVRGDVAGRMDVAQNAQFFRGHCRCRIFPGSVPDADLAVFGDDHVHHVCRAESKRRIRPQGGRIGTDIEESRTAAKRKPGIAEIEGRPVGSEMTPIPEKTSPVAVPTMWRRLAIVGVPMATYRVIGSSEMMESVSAGGALVNFGI